MKAKRRLMTKFEKELWFKFKIPGGHNLQRCKLNEWKFSAANSPKHEFQKLLKAMECQKKGHFWLMEPWEIKTNRKRDFLCLTEGVIFEWETSKFQFRKKDKEGAYDSPNFGLYVKKLWEKGW